MRGNYKNVQYKKQFLEAEKCNANFEIGYANSYLLRAKYLQRKCFKNGGNFVGVGKYPVIKK